MLAQVCAALILCLGLAGCAQSGALLGGVTGSLTSEAPGSVAAVPGTPPLPSRRLPRTSDTDDRPGLLAALPTIDLSAPAIAPSAVTIQDAPVNAYVRLAREIRRCWLNPADAKLPGHGFRATAQPGEAGEAEISIYKEAEGRKYGPVAFAVKISPQGSGALVRSSSRRLDDDLANSLRADVARWARGATGCASAAADQA